MQISKCPNVIHPQKLMAFSQSILPLVVLHGLRERVPRMTAHGLLERVPRIIPHGVSLLLDFLESSMAQQGAKLRAGHQTPLKSLSYLVAVDMLLTSIQLPHLESNLLFTVALSTVMCKHRAVAQNSSYGDGICLW